MTFERRILHYSADLGTLLGDLSEQAVEGCWFELNRLGGCGAGEVVLKSRFPERGTVTPGEWIAFEPTEGNRWYLGRVEQRTTQSPAKVVLRLEGMGVELGEIFPGGFGRGVGGGVPPHRYARTDLFDADPDYADETADSVNEPVDVVRLLMQQYVMPGTHIDYVPDRVEAGGVPRQLVSLKFRGEESVRTIVKELALRAYHASWGVDAAGEFFFLQKRTGVLKTYREGRDLLKLEESQDADLIVNRVLLTGDYVYYLEESSNGVLRGFYRWRGNYIQPTSKSLYGERRLKMWVPWIRTAEDSRQFVREVFRVYSQPVNRYLIRVRCEGDLPVPWLGRVEIESKEGELLAAGTPETIRIDFDRVPILSLTLGPEDPQTHWPEPPHDERWEIQNVQAGGGGPSDDLTFSSEGLTESWSSSSASSREESEESSGSSSGSAWSESEGETEEPSGEPSDGSESESEGKSEGSSGEWSTGELSSGDSEEFSEELSEGSEGSGSGESSEMSSEEESGETSEEESSGGETSEIESSGGETEESEEESNGESEEESGGETSGGESSGGSEEESESGESGSSESGSGETESDETDEESGSEESGFTSGSEEESSVESSESSDGTIVVPCCNNPLPSILHAEFQNETACDDWDGVSVDLYGSGGGWYGEVTDGPDPISVTLSCATGPLRWILTIEGNPCHGTKTISGGGACQPLSLTFSGVSMGAHCCTSTNGKVTVIITE